MSFDQEPDPLSDALEHCRRLVKERDRLKAEVARLRTDPESLWHIATVDLPAIDQTVLCVVKGCPNVIIATRKLRWWIEESWFLCCDVDPEHEISMAFLETEVMYWMPMPAMPLPPPPGRETT